MKVHLVDGTYELFCHFFGAPPHRNAAGQEVAAVRGVVGSVLQLLGEGAIHVGAATDHVTESFRNDPWPGYKTGAGIDLWSQAWPLEESLVIENDAWRSSSPSPTLPRGSPTRSLASSWAHPRGCRELPTVTSSCLSRFREQGSHADGSVVSGFGSAVLGGRLASVAWDTTPALMTSVG